MSPVLVGCDGQASPQFFLNQHLDDVQAQMPGATDVKASPVVLYGDGPVQVHLFASPNPNASLCFADKCMFQGIVYKLIDDQGNGSRKIGVHHAILSRNGY